MTERRASRRDLFRLLGRTVAGAAGKRLPGEPPAGAALPPQEEPVEAPLEGGRLVVDLSRYPVPAQGDRRVHHPAWPGPVLLVRVTMDHFAAVSADCPHCDGPFRYDPGLDAVACPGGVCLFRMDGLPFQGPRDLRLRVYPCHLAGQRLEIDLLPPIEEME